MTILMAILTTMLVMVPVPEGDEEKKSATSPLNNNYCSCHKNTQQLDSKKTNNNTGSLDSEALIG